MERKLVIVLDQTQTRKCFPFDYFVLITHISQRWWMRENLFEHLGLKKCVLNSFSFACLSWTSAPWLFRMSFSVRSDLRPGWLSADLQSWCSWWNKWFRLNSSPFSNGNDPGTAHSPESALWKLWLPICWYNLWWIL